MPDPKQRFSDRVADYVAYRPTYPAPLVDTLLERTGAGAGSAVADVGSGTGIFARLLLDRGLTVHAIEPNEGMRGAAERLLADAPHFHSVAGSAEATGVPDDAVDLVTAAQALHWFDRPKARAEFRRILRPSGFVALAWNERRVDTSDFLRGYEALLHAHSSEYMTVDHRRMDDAAIGEFFEGPFETIAFDNHQHLDRAGFRGRLLSSSYVPNEGQPGHDEILAAAERLFERCAVDGVVEVEYDSLLYLGTL